MRSWWRDLGGAAGSTAVGVQRVEVDPGARIGPVHVHGAEEEIFYVLGGQRPRVDRRRRPRGRPDRHDRLSRGRPAHTLIAGDDGLDVLCFGENPDPPLVHLPRAGVLRRAGFWTLAGTDPDPLEREAAAGPLEPARADAPPAVDRRFADTEVDVDEKGRTRGTEHYLSHGAGAVRSGLRHAVIPPGKDTCPPHWHSGEQRAVRDPRGRRDAAALRPARRAHEEHPLRAGHTVSRRAGSGVAHMFRAGDEGMTLLPYGQRMQNEIVFYPRSKKALVGQAFVRLDTVDDYWEGELDHGPDG